MIAAAQPAVTFLCSPNNPTGLVDPPDVVRAVLDAAPGLVVVDEAYAQFSDWTALDLVDDDVPLVVVRTFSKTWSMAAARLGYLVGPRWVVGALETVVLPYHLDAAKQLAGRLALGHVAEMDARVKQIVAERERLAEALRLPRWTRSRAAPTSSCSDRPTVPRCGRRSSTAGVLVRDCSGWPRLANCLRVTVGTPEENDRFLAALERGGGRLGGGETTTMSRSAIRKRVTKETSVEVELDLDGSGTTDCTTGIPFYDHMLDQLGRHGGFDLTVRATGDLHIDTHHTVEDVAITLGEAFREAVGDKAGIRRFASGLYPLDEALVEVALDISGRPFVSWEVEIPESLPLGTPPFDPQLAEHAVASFATNAGLTLHVRSRSGRIAHHIIEATFKGLARCLRDAVRVDAAGGIPSTKGVL